MVVTTPCLAVFSRFRPDFPALPYTAGMTGPRKGSRGHAPKKNSARSRDGSTRDTSRPRRTLAGLNDEPAAKETPSRKPGARPGGPRAAAGEGRASHPRKTGARSGGPSEGRPGEKGGDRKRTGARPAGSAGGSTAGARSGAPRAPKVKKALPELRRVQLDAPVPDTVFVDRDGQKLTFPDSNLKRVAAKILTTRNKAWRYRAFSFPLFTDRGHEQSFHFDFYIYDAEDSVIRLILVVPYESREVWDRVGRFKRQYPMYTYELWTPEKLHGLDRPRASLGF